MLRIAIIGPESSGKTELAKALESSFPETLATEEFARRYFDLHQLPADYALSREEMLAVMAGQLQTEQMVTGKCAAWIDASTLHGPLYFTMARDGQGALTFAPNQEPEMLDYAKQAGYDAFILCWPHAELTWQDDGMRAMPALEDRVCFAKACAELVQEEFPRTPLIHVDAAGWTERLQQAKEAVKRLMGSKKNHGRKNHD